MAVILHKDSHLDHGISRDEIERLLPHVKKGGFCIVTIQTDKTRKCDLHGPAMGEGPISEHMVTYQKRGDRKYESRTIDMPRTTTNLVTLVVGPHDGNEQVLYTAYPGPQAPKEPGDPTISDEEMQSSKEFWKQHALSSS